jgi:hypothetical protein
MIHSHDTAQRLARASQVAYAPPHGSDVIGDDHCLVHITRDGTNVVFAFQGTNDGIDWISNADRRYATIDQGRVHNGFASSLAVWLDAIVVEAEMIGNAEQLWITGHSRGGAHALLFAAACVARGVAVTGCYTFGSPRVGDTRFAAWCDRNIPGHHRYVYQSDIVPRLPRIGYTHCGHLHWHDGQDWRTRMPLHSRIGAWLFARRWPFIGDAAADHSIGQYIRALTP